MKVAIIADTHLGARGDNPILLEHQLTFFEEIFFPTLEEKEIINVIHLGDLFDRRKYTNHRTLTEVKNRFLSHFGKCGYKLHLIVGNHDTYYKSTNEINSPHLFASDNEGIIRVFAEANDYKPYDMCNMVMVPWITKENEQRCFDTIRRSEARICCGHFELQGFDMGGGIISNVGHDPSFLKKFDLVLSGHFHAKSQIGNITYVGTPYQLTWADFNVRKGFHILDTKTLEMEFIENPKQIFHKVFYNDVENEYLDEDFSHLKGCYVKLIEVQKKNPYLYDLVCEKIKSVNPADFKTVTPLTTMSSNAMFTESEVEDTQIILLSAVDEIDCRSKDDVKNELANLYNEAITSDTYSI